MATIPARSEKPYRMDIRLTQAQRELFERAAALKNMTLTQWSTWHLTDAARADVEEETTIRLSTKAFEEFAASLDAGMPPAMQSLLREDPIWDD